MGTTELLIICLCLAADAFAVSVCKGLSMNKINYKKAIVIGIYFGFFQGLMPMIGYCLGNTFENFVVAFDHWFSFALLSVIGINMIIESFNKNNNSLDDSISVKNMLILSIATSIDALTVGMTFAFLKVNIFVAVFMIGIITFILSIIGVIIGNKFGIKYKNIAETLGGIFLIAIGLKILLDHIGVF